MTIQLKRRLISVEDYHRMIDAGILGPQDRVELIEGQIIEMAAIGSWHAAYVDKIDTLLKKLLGEEAIVRTQNPIQIVAFSEPEPDVAIVKPRKDFYAMQHPKPSQVYLIIEVADSSLDLDREVKLPLYAAAGVPEYWILNVNAQEIEAHHTPICNTYKYREIIKPTDRVTFRAFDLVVPAKDIFILPDLED